MSDPRAQIKRRPTAASAAVKKVAADKAKTAVTSSLSLPSKGIESHAKTTTTGAAKSSVHKKVDSIGSTGGTTMIKTSKEKAAEVLAKARKAAPTSRTSRISRDTKHPTTVKPQPPQPKAVPISTKNVMNTIHNVTVASPTLKRKENSDSLPSSQENPTPPEETQGREPRIRTRTRTIDPEQSVMQKYLQLQSVSKEVVPPAPPKPPQKTPSPVAFEISLESCKVVSSENDEYEDDFESYESDFESEPSEEEDKASPESNEEENVDGGALLQIRSAITSRDEERKMDSGNYDLPASKDRSIMDGILETATEQDHHEIIINRIVGETEPPVKKSANFELSERQRNLMKTLSLDTITFHLFEQKPMDYERFMRVFGHLSSSQVAVQTKFEDACDEEMQTEAINVESRWTQNPPKFGNSASYGRKSRNYVEETMGTGLGYTSENGNKDPIKCVSNFGIDYDRLNRFLISSSNTIAQILEGNNKSDKEPIIKGSSLPQFNDSLKMELNTKEKHQVKAVHTFGQVIVVVLELENDQKKSNGRELLEIFDSSYLKAPQSVLLSWSKITSVLIQSKKPSYLFGGTAEGCINVWDWTECASHQVDEGSAVFRRRPVNANFVPEFLSLHKDYCTLIKLVELSSETNYSIPGEDLAALYSPGIIVIWSILCGSKILKEVKTIELFNKSVIPKGMKSKFEKNVTYFENNIFSDAALKELQNVKSAVDQAQNLIFTDLLLDGELLISVSNANFVAVTRMGLKNDSKKIIVSEAGDATVVKITAATVYKRGMILIALSDGTLKLQEIAMTATKSRNNWGTGTDLLDDNDEDDDNQEQQLILDKSCAIQNIVLNERKLYDTSVKDRDNWDGLGKQEGTSSSSAINNKPPGNPGDNEITERILLHGGYFQRSSLRHLSICDTGLISYMDNQDVKSYDVVTEKLSPIDHNDKKTKGIALSKDANGKDLFMVFYSHNSISVLK